MIPLTLWRNPMTYTFKVNREQREAMYAAACHAINYRDCRDMADLIGITHDTAPEITLTDTQVAAILSGLEGAIEAESRDSGDWLRAKDYMQAREYIIEQTRKQMRVVR
jgi:hypothetical protein